MRTCCTLLMILLAIPASAQHAGDIELSLDAGKIVTHGRVFGAELGEIIPNEVDEPGFHSHAGAFPAGSSLGFSLLDSLRKWNGVDFSTIPVETMAVRFGSSLGPITTPTTPSRVDGFALNVAGDGSWHRHLDFVLGSPASDGIYLLTIEMHSSDPGISPSDPFYLVFNQNESQANHAAAIAYLESAATVPEPNLAWGAVLLTGLAVANRKRRRRHEKPTPRGNTLLDPCRISPPAA